MRSDRHGPGRRGFRRARAHVQVTVGESVRILRELQGLSQGGLAGLTGIPQSTIWAIENDRIHPGVERAKVIARALRCHPAVLVFPNRDVGRESAARPGRKAEVGPAVRGLRGAPCAATSAPNGVRHA